MSHTHTDFILTYQDQGRSEDTDGTQSPEGAESGEKSKATKRREKREKYFESCKELGLTLEFQDCSVCVVV